MIAHVKNKVSAWWIFFVLSRTALFVFIAVVSIKKLDGYLDLNGFYIPAFIHNFAAVVLILFVAKVGVGDLIKRLADETKKDTVDQ